MFLNKKITLHFVLTLILCFSVSSTEPNASQQPVQSPQQPSQQPPITTPTLIEHRTSKFSSQRTCGFIDRNVYINNGTVAEVGFYSNEKFSLFVESDGLNYSVTGFAIASQMGQQQLSKIKKSNRKMFHLAKVYEISMKSENSTDSGNSKSDRREFQPKENMQDKVYYANLSIYGVCRTVFVSTIVKQLQVKVQFLGSSIHNEASPNPPSSTDTHTSTTQTITIPTTVYCIDGQSIKQTNFFVNKLYTIAVISLFGLLINFKPLKRVPFFVRILGLAGYVWSAVYVQNLYEAFFCTYGAMFLLAIFYRVFEEKPESVSQSSRRQTLLSKAYILVSFASALPLAIKSHLDNEQVQPKKIILYMVNIMMLCNSLLFISSMVNLTRFRHAFYYFLVLIVCEHYFAQEVRKLLAFNLLQLQVFSTTFNCESIFFVLWLIPLCDFFLRPYSSQTFCKFVILLIPVLAKPFYVSASAAFGLGILLWTINGRLNGRDLIRIIKYKR